MFVILSDHARRQREFWSTVHPWPQTPNGSWEGGGRGAENRWRESDAKRNRILWECASVSHQTYAECSAGELYGGKSKWIHFPIEIALFKNRYSHHYFRITKIVRTDFVTPVITAVSGLCSDYKSAFIPKYSFSTWNSSLRITELTPDRTHGW